MGFLNFGWSDCFGAVNVSAVSGKSEGREGGENAIKFILLSIYHLKEGFHPLQVHISAPQKLLNVFPVSRALWHKRSCALES